MIQQRQNNRRARASSGGKAARIECAAHPVCVFLAVFFFFLFVHLCEWVGGGVGSGKGGKKSVSSTLLSCVHSHVCIAAIFPGVSIVYVVRLHASQGCLPVCLMSGLLVPAGTEG